MYNNYEELKSFLPTFYDHILDMQIVLLASGNQLDGVEAGLNQVLLNNFIMDADEPTITRMERFLYLQVDRARSLDERKRLVASFFIGFGKMSASKIKEIVFAFTNAASDVFFEDSIISIEIERGTSQSLYLIDLDTILSRRLPAHLPFVLVVKYTVETTVSAKTSGYVFQYPLTNMLRCGTYPETATLGKLNQAEINVSADIYQYLYDYKLCGTIPDIATIGLITGSNIDTNLAPEQHTFDYVLCGTRRTGE